MSRLGSADAAIAINQSLSNIIDLRNHRLVGIEMPAAWTAAAISFQSAFRDDGSGYSTALTETFQDVFDSAGVEVSLTLTAGKYVLLTEAHRNLLAGLGRIKVRSGVTGAAVNQLAARVVRLILEPRESNT